MIMLCTVQPEFLLSPLERFTSGDRLTVGLGTKRYSHWFAWQSEQEASDKRVGFFFFSKQVQLFPFSIRRATWKR